MKKSLLTTLILCSSSLSIIAQDSDSAIFNKISTQILTKGKSYSDLKVLCKTIGHRISGSAAAEKAVQWGYQTMLETGCDSVWLQEVKVPVWVRGEEHLAIQFNSNEDYIDVPLSSLGNSEGTNGKLIKAPIVLLQDFSELEKYNAEFLAGKILFFNYRFRQDFVHTFPGYGDAVKYRWQSSILSAAFKPAAIIIRSISTGDDDYPHTGSTKYPDNGPKIPMMAVGNKTADRIEQACKNNTVHAMLKSTCTMKGEALSYNVIGEIKGSSNANEYLIVGGHLDSWDIGEGAHDDGAGCVQAIEVLRTFKALNLKPKHSIRAVLFMNEENGLRGGLAYADSAKARNEKHIFALESDAGGFSPRGIESTMSTAQRKRFTQKFAPLFLPYGVYDFERDGGGADVSPLKKLGTIVGELIPDSQRYFDLHHSDQDVFEQVNPRELKLGAAAMTMMLYISDKYGL